MRGLDLFSGYGGLTLALSDYITEVIAYVEIEEYAQKIVAYRMADGSLPKAPIFADVKNVKGALGICDIIYGGFPCQDLSVAGNGKGLAGERSGLFFEIVRLAKEIRPTFVFLENVPAIRARGLEQVIKAFTEIGYDCRWTCLSAASVGANHQRDRWFLLAHSNSGRCEARELVNVGKKTAKEDGCRNKFTPSIKCIRTEISNSSCEGINYARDRSWWEAEPSVGRVVDGTPFRVDRIEALGNGVVPLQAKKAFEKLIGIK